MPRSLTTLSTDAMPNSLQALATPGVAPVTASGSQVPGGGQGEEPTGRRRLLRGRGRPPHRPGSWLP